MHAGSHFSGFRSVTGSGVSCSGTGTTVTLDGCSFRGNTADARYGGALLADGGDVLLANCTFAANGENDVAVQGGTVWAPDNGGPAINVRRPLHNAPHRTHSLSSSPHVPS